MIFIWLNRPAPANVVEASLFYLRLVPEEEIERKHHQSQETVMLGVHHPE